MTEAYTGPSEVDFTVLGSGVIGLLTAHELAEAGHRVKVISREGMPTMGTDSTSAIAIGQFLPFLPEGHTDTITGSDMAEDLKSVVEESRSYYDRLAKNPHETGVLGLRNLELVGESLTWPAGLAEAMHVTETELTPPIELTDTNGGLVTESQVYEFDTFSINARKTLAWLAEEARRKGISFDRQNLTPEDLNQLDGVIVNATGIGAKQLTGDQDIQHFKGHTFVLRPRTKEDYPTKAMSVDDLVIMPREDGTVIAGALYIESPDRAMPLESEAEELMRRLTELAEKTRHMIDGLRPTLFTAGESLVHSAGYRLVLESGGIRVAPDDRIRNLLHAYGFSGIGWSVGPVYAKKIAKQALEMRSSQQ